MTAKITCETKELKECTKDSITITIQDAQVVGACKVDLYFDPKVILYLGYDKGHFEYTIVKEIQENGKYHLDIRGINIFNPIDAPIILAKIKVKAIGEVGDYTTLDIKNSILKEYVRDRRPPSIEHVVEDGAIYIVA